MSELVSIIIPVYNSQKYLAYFQAFTNTYAPLKDLIKLYEEALSHEDVIGLVIATRPDSIKDDVLDYLEKLAERGFFIKLEFGLESTKNKTLEFINRCQTHEEAIDAFNRAKNRGLHLGGHLILGLPGETKEDMLDHARKVSELPIDTLKIHHLQIVKHTMMAIQFKRTPEIFTFMELEEYIDLVVDFLEILNPDIIVERFFSESPARMLIHPKYGLKNFEVKHLVEKRLEERDNFFWMSPYAFKIAIKLYPSILKKHHSCGMGNTFEQIKEIITNEEKLTPYLSYEHWLNKVENKNDQK